MAAASREPRREGDLWCGSRCLALAAFLVLSSHVALGTPTETLQPVTRLAEVGPARRMAQGAFVGQEQLPGGKKAGKGKDRDIVGELKPGADPHSPHEMHGFEPRPGPYEVGGNIWTFGKAHAALHHVLREVPKGDPAAAANAMDAFAAKHGLKYHIGIPQAIALDNATRQAVAEAATHAAVDEGIAVRQLNVLVLGAGLGTRLLRCLPALLESTPAAGTHEVVSVEHDAHLSGYGHQLFNHAVGIGEDSPKDAFEVVGHLPLMPAEDTTLEEVLESLREGYEFSSFDLVLLEDGPDGRLGQQHQLTTLLATGALGEGAVVHAEGAGLGDIETTGYLELLKQGVAGGQRFHSEVHDLGDGGAAVVSILRRRSDGTGEEL